MRRSFTLVSIVLHTIAIAAGLYAQLIADSSPLPTPHSPLMFEFRSFMPVDVQPPRPRVMAAKAGGGASPNAAPLVPPSGVSEETGREQRDPSPLVGLVAGNEGGPPSSLVDGFGAMATAPPPPPPVTPIRLHSGMKAPVKIADVAPTYPMIARSARVQGVVILEAVLDASGSVESVRVLRSIPLLDQAALDAVRQWRFTPALLNGEPVPVVMTVTVNFTLEGR